MRPALVKVPYSHSSSIKLLQDALLRRINDVQKEEFQADEVQVDKVQIENLDF